MLLFSRLVKGLMMRKYRIFYDLNYHGDVLDYTEDIKARTDKEAVKKAKRFIEKMNNERKEQTKVTLIENKVPGAERFTDEQLLIGNYFELTGVSRVKEALVKLAIKKEDLQAVSVS